MVENFVLEVFKAVSLRMAAFWVIVPCSLETVIFSNFFSFALFIVKVLAYILSCIHML